MTAVNENEQIAFESSGDARVDYFSENSKKFFKR